MSASYKVHWAGIAEADLKDIILYIAGDSPAKARTVFENIKEKATTLSQFPERGRTVPELQDHGIYLYREIIIVPWRMIYRIAGKKIYILSILDSRQNVEDILLQRLIK